MDRLLKTAFDELGEKKINGTKYNQTIAKYAQEAGFKWINDDETPWCSIFINWVAKKSGLKGNTKNEVRSWLRIGINVDTQPEPGDIVIFWKEEIDSFKGNIGIYLGYSSNQKRIYYLGGNQGNQVSVSADDSNKVLGFRRLVPIDIITIPSSCLKTGDSGAAVKQLQEALKSEGFNCGTSDGIYGPATTKAVKELQSQQKGLTIDGIYNTTSRDFLNELIKE